MTRGKTYRAGWENPDTARRRAVAVRHFRDWLTLAATVYAAFGPKLHI